MTELVQACDEERRTHSEESVKDGCTMKTKRGRPRTRWKDACDRDMKSTELSGRGGGQGDMEREDNQP